MIARLKCLIFGHRRGKRIAETAIVKCPRCGSEWIRLSKKKAA